VTAPPPRPDDPHAASEERQAPSKGRGSDAKPIAVVLEFLEGAFQPDRIIDVANRLVADDATYVSLNYEDSELNRIMPWAGTKHGRSAFIDNFTGVTTRWTREAFTITDTVEQNDKVALFGQFSLRSVTLGQAVTSALVVFAKVQAGQITYFQYMEDTFATALSFRTGGSWTIAADPTGKQIQV
jgi:ketosteroid isomerase-like protein